jgi:hypothetical protein
MRPDEKRSGASLGMRRFRALITGIGFFFPAFLLSLPVTCTWADHRWPGDGQAILAALPPSFAIAFISSVICCVYLLRKVGQEQPPKGASGAQTLWAT